MASSSSAIDSCDNYDVFLSFRGVDTRCNFTAHLYDALCRKNIKVFIDYNIDRGDEITPALERAIEGARISIIVFSQDYASSHACMNELVKIMECRESKKQIVFPIFYQVEPSEATYEKAFDEHKAKSDGKKRRREETMEEEMKKVEKWKSALRQAIGLAGRHIKKDSNEVKVIGEIIETISKKLNSSQSNGEKLMCTSIIGQTAEDIFKQVREWLMNNNVSRVGIYGMGGIGKTTIANRINDELLDSNAFTHVCWVTVSKELSIYKLQSNIAKAIELDLSKEDDKLKRAAKLRERLKIKKFVLILDDVWEAFKIEEVGIPHLVGAQKLLLTSRNRQVCERMECRPIEVKRLSEEEALDLFIEESKYKRNDSLQWKAIVRSVVREFAGLPLAIVVVARSMIGVLEIREWRNTLRELQKPCEGENQEMKEKVFRSLKFSYDRLSNDKVRQCFLYCSLFPEDFVFWRDDLIMCLIGEGIINELDSMQVELDKGHGMIEELINASLLENTKYGIKMHDVVRDMGQIVIKENSKTQDGLKVQGQSEETERCVNHRSVLTLEDSMLERGVPMLPPNCSTLTTLSLCKLYVIRKLPSCFFFFVNIQNLVVLDMRYLYSLKSLPYSISYLGNLRVLLLHGCSSLRNIPSLAGLKNLWDLDLSFTNLKDIPEGIEKLINLRVLKLSWKTVSWIGYGDVVFPGAFLEKLSHLQMLEIEKVEVEADVLISFKKLETLRITFYKLESLNSYFKLGHWKRLKEYFFVCNPKNLDIYGVLWEDKELKKVLHINDFGSEKGETDMVLPNSIQKLVLDQWNGSVVDVVMNSTFHNLRELTISRCEGIQQVFTSALVKRVLHNVEILNIYDYWLRSEVEEIISEEEELVGEINNYTTIHLPNLKSLQLESLGMLRSIYKGRMVCPSLELIQIVYCWEKLERLPFCMKERNKHNPIKLELWDECWKMPNEWWDNECWDSLQWDDPNDKSFYQYKTEDDQTGDVDPTIDDDPTGDVDPSTSYNDDPMGDVDPSTSYDDDPNDKSIYQFKNYMEVCGAEDDD